jgi:hypothetical protein
VKFAVPPAETCVPAMTFLPSIRANVAGESIAPSVLRDLPGPSANLHNSSVWAVPPCAQSRTSIEQLSKPAYREMRCLMERRRRAGTKMRLNIAQRPMRNVG